MSPSASPVGDDLLVISRCIMKEPLENWQYKAEGGANVVLTYVGKSKTFEHCVLRVRKIRDCNGDSRENSSRNTETLFNYDPVDFAADIMQPLLSSKFFIPGIRVPVSKEFLLDLQRVVESASVRPDSRRHTQLDTNLGWIVLMTDYTMNCSSSVGDDIVALEIKPKCMIPLSLYNSDSDEPTELLSCSFCLKQIDEWLSVHRMIKIDCNNCVTSTNGFCDHCLHSLSLFTSRYCPLKLTSSTQESIMNLLETPQNNIRVFCNGTLIYPDPSIMSVASSKRVSSTSSFLEESLARLNLFSPSENEECVGFDRLRRVRALSEFFAHKLSKSGVFDQILKVQRLCTEETSIYAAKCALELFLSSLDGVNSPDEIEHILSTSDSHVARHARDRLTSYLLGRSAIDCSVLVACNISRDTNLEQSSNESVSDVMSDSEEYSLCRSIISRYLLSNESTRGPLSIGIVDLDAKPFSRFSSYWKKNLELFHVARSHLHCVNPNCLMKSTASRHLEGSADYSMD